MNPNRLPIVVAGLAAFAAAAAVVLVPGVGSSLPVDAAVEALGYDYLLVAVLGAVAFVATLPVMAARAVGGIDQAAPPEPEAIETVPPPGAAVDAIVEDGLGLRSRVFDDPVREVRDRVRESAVRAVARADGCSRAEARRRVEEGTWTNDPAAAAFLAEDGDVGGGRWTGLRAVAAGELPAQRGVRRAAAAIVALHEEDPAATDSRPSGTDEAAAEGGRQEGGRGGSQGWRESEEGERPRRSEASA